MLSVRCQHCDKALKVKPELAGKKVKCPGCGQVVLVPALHPISSPGTADSLPPSMSEQATIDQAPPPPEATHPSLSKPENTVSPEPSDADAALTDFLAPAESDDELGRLGGFRILKVLGHGGMGVVFLAEDPRLGRKVAIKAMLPHLAQSRTSQQRFLREAKAAAALEHDHIVPILQVGEDRGAPFIVMPFLKGEALDKCLHREGKLPLTEVARIGREIASGLEAAHTHGLIHRDIKPANVWLESNEPRPLGSGATQPRSLTVAARMSRVKILDFGLARASAQSEGLTQQGAIIGTPSYMAPEQARGEEVDARCDLWALGVVLYRMATGKMPFVGRDTVSTLMAVAMNEPSAPSQVNHALPPEFSALVMKLLAKDVNERVQTAAEVVLALSRFEAREGRQPPVSGRTSTSTTKDLGADVPRSRRKRWTLTVTALLFSLVAAAIFFWQRSGDTTDPIPPAVAVVSGNHVLEFDGDAFVQLPVLNAKFPVRPDDPFTLEAWAKPTQDKTRDNRPESRPYVIWSNSYNSGIYIDVSKKKWAGAVYNLPRTYSTTPVMLSRPVRLAVTFDGKSLRLFVDGKLQVSEPLNRSAFFEGEPLRLGSNFIGQIDDVRISRVCRYTADYTPGRPVKDEDTVALYHVDEGKGEILKDSSGHGHHGKIAGAKWVKIGDDAAPPPPAGATYALQFDGDNKEQIRIRDVAFHNSPTVTLEAYATPTGTGRGVLSAHGLSIIRTPREGDHFEWSALTSPKASAYFTKGVLNKRVHIAAVLDGNEVRLFLDGAQVGKCSPEAPPIDKRSRDIVIGAFQGVLSEIRISKSARYTKSFSPAVRLSADEETVALYHCDEGEGDLLKDSSGNGHDAKIVGAKWVKVDGTPPSPKLSLAERLTSPDYECSEPVHLGPNVNSGADDFEPTVSADGLCLIFTSNRSGGGDLYECRRKSIDEPWGPATPVAGVNVSSAESSANLSADGLTLLFAGTAKRKGAQGDMDLYVSQRATRDQPWQVPVNLGPEINTTARDTSPCLSADGLTLYFVSDRESTNKRRRVWVSQRKALDAAWQKPAMLGLPINNNAPNNDLQLLPDDKSLLYSRGFTDNHSLYLATPAPAGGYLEWPITLPYEDGGFWLLADGETLIFSSKRSGGQGELNLWQTRCVPKSALAPASRTELQFRGGESFVLIPKLPFPPDGPLTIEGYMRRSEAGKMPTTYLGWTNSFEILDDKNGKPGIKLHYRNTKTPAGFTASFGIAEFPEDDVHFAVIRDNDTLYTFIDGKCMTVGSKLPAGRETNLDMPFRFGGPGFHGAFRDVRISRSARYKHKPFKGYVPDPKIVADADTLALYRFDEGAGEILKDHSGNGHDGKIVGAKWVKVVEKSTASAAKADHFLEFDGKSHYVEVPALSCPESGPVTIEGYFTPRKFVETFGQVGLRLSGEPGKAWVSLDASKTQSWYAIAGHGADGRIVIHSQEAQEGVRKHVAVVWEGGDTPPHLFVDGKRRKASSKSALRTIVKAHLTIGATYSQDSKLNQFFAGSIDEVRISKSVRYNADFSPAPRFETDDDTLALYHFDEGEGDVLKDSSGHEHHGKIVGAKWVKADGTTASVVPQGDHALRFERSHFVEVPSLQYAGGSVTLEAFLTTQSTDNNPHTAMFLGTVPEKQGLIAIQQRGDSWFGIAGLDPKRHFATASVAPKGRRSHVAVVWNGTDPPDLFIDGMKSKEPLGAVDRIISNRTRFALGSTFSSKNEPVEGFKGIIDEVRVSKSVRYVTNFDPAQRFAPDADTLALYHCDEGEGDVLKDSSGNEHHGKIVGAKWVKVQASAPRGLLFQAKDRVELPTLPIADNGEMCFEAWATPNQLSKELQSVVTSQWQAGLLTTTLGHWQFSASLNKEWHHIHSPAKAVVGRRTHVAGVLRPDGIRLYVDGKLVESKALEKHVVGKPKNETFIGGGWLGLIEQVRISKTSRYDANFTPASLLETDADTLALYLFDEGQGEVLKDHSGHGRDGKIIGANRKDK